MYVASVHEESPSDQEDQSEGDTADRQGIPRLDSMIEEEERDLVTLSLAPVTVPKCFWRAQEDSKDSKSHSKAHDVFITSQTGPVITQVVVQAQSTRSRSV